MHTIHIITYLENSVFNYCYFIIVQLWLQLNANFHFNESFNFSQKIGFQTSP